jgi:hypothetical protein
VQLHPLDWLVSSAVASPPPSAPPAGAVVPTQAPAPSHVSTVVAGLPSSQGAPVDLKVMVQSAPFGAESASHCVGVQV